MPEAPGGVVDKESVRIPRARTNRHTHTHTHTHTDTHAQNATSPVACCNGACCHGQVPSKHDEDAKLEAFPKRVRSRCNR
jgi:hypothetical protein